MHWKPELVRNITPPGRSGFSLRLAPAYANAFPQIEQQLSYIEVTDVQMHKVRKGDTLSRIAKHYKVAVKQIMSVNPNLKASRLRPGHEIAIPIPGVVTNKGHAAVEPDRKVF
jgi:membrane-bound lytic murein transglycosylase D